MLVVGHGADRHLRAGDQGRWTTGPGRRRPGRAAGSSFPSGHAAHSTLYVWLAVTFAMRLGPGITRGALVSRRGSR